MSSARARGRRVAVVGAVGHRLQADRLQGGGRRSGRAARGGGSRRRWTGGGSSPRSSPSNGALAGQEAVEGGAEAVDVAGRAEPVERPRGLLGAHVGRRAERPSRAASRREPLAEEGDAARSPALGAGSARADGLGQAPVDDQGLAVLAEHDVARLEVAVEHAPAVGVGDRVADVEEPAAAASRSSSVRSPGSRCSASVGVERARWPRLRLSPWMNRIA